MGKIDIYPSQIIICNHYDPFTKKKITHPFVVWRVQGINCSLHNNIYAFRMTSQTDYAREDYSKVLVYPTEKNGLKEVTAICTDSIFLLNAKDVKVISQLDSMDFLHVIRSREKCEYIEIEQALHSYENNLRYEQKENCLSIAKP